MNGTSSFEKGGLRRIFGRCDELTTENLPQSLFFKEGSAVRKTYQWLNTSNFNKPLANIVSYSGFGAFSKPLIVSPTATLCCEYHFAFISSA
jgi:hypothetical protein